MCSETEHVMQDGGGRLVLGESLLAGSGRPCKPQQGDRPRNSLTPELASDDNAAGQHEDSSACHAMRKLFPIFRPLAQRKVLSAVYACQCTMCNHLRQFSC
jgi:hypothetical protein